ncbi:MAG: hypothetical protein INR71_05510, partial [Terriglobus roseus]|nr:hypothetical protein [Terriglobus roseus]
MADKTLQAEQRRRMQPQGSEESDDAAAPRPPPITAHVNQEKSANSWCRIGKFDVNIASTLVQRAGRANSPIMAPQTDSPSLSHLSNPLATPEQLSSSGSQLDGVPADLEASILFAGARLTQLAGILLRLPQEIIAEAIVTYTRFWVGAEGGSLKEYGARV